LRVYEGFRAVPSRSIRALVLATLAASLVAGAFTFPRALEPGRSDRDGIALAAALGGGDWLPGSAQVEVRSLSGRGLALRAVAPGLLLVTRGLPVDPGECYTALVRARAQTPGVSIALYDESIRQLLAEAAVPRTARPEVNELQFDPSGRARVTFAIIGNEAPSRASIAWLRLVRRQC